MPRSCFLSAVLVLALGCQRLAPPPPPRPVIPPVPPGVLATDFPRIEPRARFQLPGEVGSGVQLSADGKTLAVAYDTPRHDKSFTQIWNLAAEPKVVAAFPGRLVALSPSGRRVLTSDGSPNHRKVSDPLRVYAIGSQKPVATLPASLTHAFFRDDATVVVTQESFDFAQAARGKVTIWDVTQDADAGSFEVPDNRFISALPVKGGRELWLFMGADKFEIECYDLVESHSVSCPRGSWLG